MFSIFDMNNDGTITKTEMLCIMSALYKLQDKRMSARVKQVGGRVTSQSHVETIFKNLDKNNDQKLTKAEFVQIGSTDVTLMQLVFGSTTIK